MLTGVAVGVRVLLPHTVLYCGGPALDYHSYIVAYSYTQTYCTHSQRLTPTFM